MSYPTDRRYSKEHEWVLVDGGSCKIGITDFAQSELGDIVFVEMPEDGKEVAAGDVIGTIESVKAVSEIFAPVSGKVTAGNAALTDQPELVNQEPHGGGWYCEIELSNPDEVDGLMDAAAYGEFAGN